MKPRVPQQPKTMINPMMVRITQVDRPFFGEGALAVGVEATQPGVGVGTAGGCTGEGADAIDTAGTGLGAPLT